MPFKHSIKNNQAGYLLVLVLVFGSIFLVIISSFIGFVITQNQVVNFRHEQQRATEIAEAGLNYYRWYLAHFPDDTTTTLTNVYEDQESNAVGEYSLNISRSSFCGNTASIEVESTAFTYDDPSAVSTISARYARPTVAEYSFISNAGVWYGDSRVITGPVHGNSWVRMDGFHNSFVGSGIASYDGNDGVYTTTANATPGLFRFPISPIDFGGLTIDLSGMRSSAIADGIYFGPTSEYGYRLLFNGDGTVDVYEVTRTRNYWSYSTSEGWHTGERNDVRQDQRIADDLAINPDCPVLFFEDKLWIEGDISQKVAVGVGLNSSNAQNNIVIHNDLDYVLGTNAGLVAIAEDDVDVGIQVQNDMNADGIFIAQNGRFGRNHYVDSGYYRLPGVLDGYVSRDSLTRLGSVVSNLRGGTEWSDGSGSHISGFRSRVTSFDRDQVDNPPPLTPETSDVYIFDDWRQDG